MNVPASNRKRSHKSRFVPRLEALEERTLLTVGAPRVLAPGVIEFVATTPPTGSTNTLNLFDDGHGAISFNTGGTSATVKVPAAAGAHINTIFYLASSGTDTLNFNTLNKAALQEHLTIDVFLPSGNNKSFTANFGRAPQAAIAGSPGTPLTPAVSGTNVNIARTGSLFVTIFGSPLKNNATLAYTGQVKGKLGTFYFDGSNPTLPAAALQDGDKVVFQVNLSSGSNGFIHPKIKGGIGDDDLTLFVNKSMKDNPTILGFEAIDGGGGMNIGISAPPITMINIQA